MGEGIVTYRARDVLFFSPRQRLDFLCRKKETTKGIFIYE